PARAAARRPPCRAAPCSRAAPAAGSSVPSDRAPSPPSRALCAGPPGLSNTAGRGQSGAMRVGIDLGGTKIEIIALDPDGTERFRQRVPTPGDYQGVIDAIRSLVDAAEQDVGERGSVGVGMPGCISPATGLVKGANSTFLN